MNIIFSVFSGFLGIGLLISVVIVILSLFSSIPRKIGFRNIKRRLGNTILVIIGSMVGSALIAGSLVLSDSLDKTFKNIVEDQLDEVDLLITAEEKRSLDTPVAYVTSNEITQIEETLDTDEIDGVMPVDFLQVSPEKINSDGESVLNMYQVTLYAIDTEDYNDFGEDQEKPIDAFETSDSVFITDYIGDRLEVSEGDMIGIPYAGRVIKARVQKVYERGYIPGDPVIYMDRNYLNEQLGLPEGSANTLFVSAAGGIEPSDYDGEVFQDHIEEQLDGFEAENAKFSFYEAKSQALDGFGLKVFADLFLVMSSFGIFAGILLIVNLYLMLASERKYEMGIMRAIALTRFQLMKTFVNEGVLYSIFSSLLGTTVGVGIGYVLVYTLNSMFSKLFDLVGQADIFTVSFHVNPSSLLVSFGIGTFITMMTILFASYRISRLNIVEAIRGISETKKKKINIRWILTTLLLFVMTLASIFSLFSFFTIRDSLTQMRNSGNEHFLNLTPTQFEETLDIAQAYSLYVGLVFTAIFGVFLFNRLFKLISKVDISRYTITISSLVVIIFTGLLSKLDSFLDAGQTDAGLPLFFLSGLVLVIALSLIVTYNLQVFTWIVSGLLYPIKGLIPVVKISLRYPSVNRGRTGLTLIMFAVVIYLIVFTSMMKVTMREINTQTLNETLGGYDSLVVPAPQMGQSGVEEIENKIDKTGGVSQITQMMHTQVIMPEYKYKDLAEAQVFDNPAFYQFNEEDPFATRLDGLSKEFIENRNIELVDRLDSYADDSAVWDDVISDPTKVVLGRAFVDDGYGRVPELNVGDKVKIAGLFGQDQYEAEIVGIAASEGGMGFTVSFYNYIVTTNDAIQAQFPAEYTDRYTQSELLIGFDDSVSNLVDKNKDIRKALISENIVQILQLDELTQTGQSFMDSMILMFQGFLGFSLIVGSSGLAIIVARSVQERRQQIGMLRSLGFQKRMILTGFFIEATFITLLGILIGISMGTLGALNIFYISFADRPEVEPVFAYKEVFIISVLVYIASLLFAIWPSIEASRLSPVEATNYPE